MNQMKKIFIITLVFLISFGYGCKKFLDVNHDPNNPEESTVQLVFPAAVTSSMSIWGSYGLMLGNIWAQYWTSDLNAPQYQNEDSYNVTAGDYNYDIGIWRGMYAGPLMDYEWVRNTARQDSNWTYYLMATVMQSYNYFKLSCLWENIPLSEALQGYNPHYDMGADIYDTLVARIDEALSHDLNATTCEQPADDDLIFNGDMTKWVKLANTLKLHIYLREADARPTVAQQGIQAMFDANAEFIDEDVKYDVFADELGRDNPMYGMEFRGGNMNMRASKTLLDFLNDNGDDRYKFIYKPNSSGNYVGIYQGDYRNVYTAPDQEGPEFSSPRILPLMPFYFYTKAEVELMLAEVNVRYGLGTDAATLYNNAIESDVNRLNKVYSEQIANGDLTSLDASTVQSKYNFPNNGTEQDKIEAIIVQKWICLANIDGLEGFFEHNRTGYPKESPYLLSDENFADNYVKGQWTVSVTSVLAPPIRFPKRLIYSSTEQSKNPNTPPVKLLNAPQWWDYQYQGK